MSMCIYCISEFNDIYIYNHIILDMHIMHVYIYIQLKTYTCNIWSYESLAHPNHQRLEVKREVVPPLVRIHGHPGFMVNSKCLFLWGYHKPFCGL